MRNNSNNWKYFTIAFYIIYGLLYSLNVYSIPNTSKPGFTIPLDSSKIEVRTLTAADQEKLMGKSDYIYDKTGPAPVSLWNRFWNWFWRLIEKIFDSKGGKLGWNIFKMALIIAAIVIIIVLVIKNNLRTVFYGKSTAVAIDFKEFADDINKISFEELIAQAISNKDFRKAVRLHFLKLLKELTEQNIIKWQPNKTNTDYSMELADSKYYKQFNELSFMYEYIWYGDFRLDETNFRSAISKFKEFHL